MSPAGLTTPVRFEPYLRPMPWGGRALATLLGKKLPGDGPLGESWELSDHPLHRSILASGERAGQSIRTLMQECSAALFGDRQPGPTFPWLVKFLDARGWLSVQVHPDQQMVGRLSPGEGPKSEAWFILDAAPGSRIFAGLRPGVGPDEFRRALADGTVAGCLHQFEPRPGHFLYLPAGTVHAVGGGVVFAEIQQTSDATLRLFDWNRRDDKGKPRPLQIEEGLAAMHWDQGPKAPQSIDNFSLATGHEGSAHREELVRCAHFDLDYFRETASFCPTGDGRMRVLVVFAGQARWESGDELLPGQVWLLSASLRPQPCQPSPRICGMMCTLP